MHRRCALAICIKVGGVHGVQVIQGQAKAAHLTKVHCITLQGPCIPGTYLHRCASWRFQKAPLGPLQSHHHCADPGGGEQGTLTHERPQAKKAKVIVRNPDQRPAKPTCMQLLTAEPALNSCRCRSCPGASLKHRDVRAIVCKARAPSHACATLAPSTYIFSLSRGQSSRVQQREAIQTVHLRLWLPWKQARKQGLDNAEHAVGEQA